MNEQEFWAALTPVEPVSPVYRLYYDDQGWPLYYSMEQLPGNYIELDRETYQSSPTNIRIVDGQLTVIKPVVVIHKLKPTPEGTPCHPNDVCIVVDSGAPNTTWSLQTNEIT